MNQSRSDDSPADAFVRCAARLALLTAMLAAIMGNGLPRAAQSDSNTGSALSSLVGNYQVAPGHVLGIDLYAEGGRESLVYSDYRSGVIRRLVPSSDGFDAGPGSGITAPREFTVRFEQDGSGNPSALVVEAAGKKSVRAPRLGIVSTDVTFRSSDAILAGTLLVPQNSKPPHPAVVLLHGSGRLTRYSFGPYPHFFTSVGLAVLVFDKRGTGASSGRFFDRTTHYPDVFADDALEAVRFLQQRSEIDPSRVGLWGISEGGMLTTQVAARSTDVAFIINSSGFMVPLRRQVMFNIEAQLRADGFSREDVAEAVKFEASAMRVMQTGAGWEEYSAAQVKARDSKWFRAYFGQSGGFSSLESLRRQWDYVYRFDPLPALKMVRCPVLALFGELDTSTPAQLSAENMRRGLRAAGNRNARVEIIKRANHPLMEAKTGGNAEMPGLGRMAPGVFDLLRSWIETTVMRGRATAN